MYHFVKGTCCHEQLISLQNTVHIQALLWYNIHPRQICSCSPQTGPVTQSNDSLTSVGIVQLCNPQHVHTLATKRETYPPSSDSLPLSTIKTDLRGASDSNVFRCSSRAFCRKGDIDTQDDAACYKQDSLPNTWTILMDDSNATSSVSHSLRTGCHTVLESPTERLSKTCSRPSEVLACTEDITGCQHQKKSVAVSRHM